jgi:hypothetical protein
MDDAGGQALQAAGAGADDPLADRYAIGSQLGQNDRVKTFRATDRRFNRPVVMVFDTGSGGETLAETCLAMAGVLSPNLVDIYDHGDSATHPFAVFELPMSTVASLVQDPGQSLWNQGWASDTAEQLALALVDLRGSGVDTSGLHFGHIGIDGTGRVRLSPWPLADPPEGFPVPASEQELVASVRDSGARASGSFGSSKAAEIDATLRQTSAGREVPLTPERLPGAFAADEASVDDEPTGEVPVTTGAALLSYKVASPADRGRHRVRLQVAGGAGVAAVAAFLAFALVSYNPPAPADASTNAVGACAGKTKPCAVQTDSKSPSTTAGLQLPITPVSAPATTAAPPSPTTTTTTDSGAGGRAVPPVGAAPTTSEAPSTTTTTEPPSTTTTTMTVPPTTTTTTTTVPPTTTTTEPPTTTTTTTTTTTP